MENKMISAETNSAEPKDEKQKESKLEEQILKSMNHCTTIEEKFNFLIKKYVELEKENKRQNAVRKQYEKRFDLLLREKDNLQKDHNKGVLMRDKLEQVCREQQKLIKSVKNESLSKIREEEERRKLLQAKFEQSVNEITLAMAKTSEENQKLRDDNIEMSKKLKYLAEQYQVREKQYDKVNEQVQLEAQLHDAKLAKLKMEGTIEKEVLLREKQTLLDELLSCKKAIAEMQTREDQLKQHLHLYTSKYDDFQNSLQKSNDIFTSYKSEIEKMSKTIRKLEKESMDWKRKCEKSNASLFDLATENQSRSEYTAKLTRQLEQLQKLLRTLQAERTMLHQVLKENNIERPSAPILPPEPEPIPAPPPPKVGIDKMDLMAKNCAELKETLSKLQGQMNAISNKQNEKEVVEPKKNKSKRVKNKNKGSSSKTEISDKNEVEGNVTADTEILENVADSQVSEGTTEVESTEDQKVVEIVTTCPNEENVLKNENDAPCEAEEHPKVAENTSKECTASSTNEDDSLKSETDVLHSTEEHRKIREDTIQMDHTTCPNEQNSLENKNDVLCEQDEKVNSNTQQILDSNKVEETNKHDIAGNNEKSTGTTNTELDSVVDALNEVTLNSTNTGNEIKVETDHPQ